MKDFVVAKKRADVSVGESVRIIREMQGMSQNRLAELSGIPQGHAVGDRERSRPAGRRAREGSRSRAALPSRGTRVSGMATGNSRLVSIRPLLTMSARRFRGKLCVYCCLRPATTGDHIFSREFFVLGARGNLPQAPACSKCNNDKSRLEHYLTGVLPFGGQHPDAHDNLINLVPGRLARNLPLQRSLSAGQGRIWLLEDAVFREAMTLPVEHEKICSLFSHIARALVWHHWSEYLLHGQDSKALLLTDVGSDFFAPYLQ
jgi:hypothetical protein